MLPFIIQKFVFENESLARIVEIDDPLGTEGKIPGYFVMSNAPANIEDAEEGNIEIQQQAKQGIDAIADHLCRMMAMDVEGNTHGNAELVITVHGYNTDLKGVEAWYKDIFKYVNHHDAKVSDSSNRVFIGYRWPSQNVDLNPKKIFEALEALPPVPRGLLMTGGTAALALLFFELFTNFQPSISGFLVALLLILFFALGMLIVALVVLRLVEYFRDSYRADNFGVLDLVELLHEVDQAILRRTVAEELSLVEKRFPHYDRRMYDRRMKEQLAVLAQARKIWTQPNHNKVKLSFIGHSMGGFVVTKAVRLLSDIFEPKIRPRNLGNVYELERLILASPDIPVLTIVSSRANVLASSLEQFAESYLFSSEGDIALRIASTAANYIAFPSKTQERGYRLGNVALQNQTGTASDYGIINLDAVDNDFPVDLPIGEAFIKSKERVMDNLFLTAQRFHVGGVTTMASLFRKQVNRDFVPVVLADYFTYFDCTDYTDIKYNMENETCTTRPKGILTRALGRVVLKPIDYLLLTFDYATSRRDVHGGYFKAPFSRHLLYRLAFLGFSDYLDCLDDDRQVALSMLHLQCRRYKIQSYLSPMRYRISVQGEGVSGTQTEMLEMTKRYAP
ncbi:MAG: hypothetical protein DCF32_04680 [Leptolyngbya sp.]|nr:MAG: hypothetical protein DCF32_04680 [Leptolyngbya sp.]